jgi:hypothetical protein
MRDFLLGGFALVVSLGLAACGGGGTVAAASSGPSCAGTNAGLKFCSDFTVPDGSAALLAQLEEACTSQLEGTYSTKACSRAGAVGGCEFSANGAEEITWIYSDSGASAGQVEDLCAQQNQGYVTP